MIRVTIPREAMEAIGIDPDKSYTLDLSGCRTFKDVQGETVDESLVVRRGAMPYMEVADKGGQS